MNILDDTQYNVILSVIECHSHSHCLALNAKIEKKTSVYHTVNGDRALFQTSKTAKNDKGYITASSKKMSTERSPICR